jgi:hypothetical protein
MCTLVSSKKSAEKLNWTLDTYFKDNKILNSTNPPNWDPKALDL